MILPLFSLLFISTSLWGEMCSIPKMSFLKNFFADGRAAPHVLVTTYKSWFFSIKSAFAVFGQMISLLLWGQRTFG
jgi:hypothetical protein